MLWLAILGAMSIWFTFPSTNSARRGSLQIMPRPCWVNGVEGTCMFVYECIKTDGFHIGMCVDNFMFGSCCAHNVTENTILSQKHKPSVIYNLPSQNIQTTKKPVEEHRSTRVPQSSHSTKLQSSVSNQTQTLISLIRPSSSSRNPTPPSRHSERPSITDGFQLDDSNVIYTFTKPGWQSTTEPGFITSLHQNSMYSQFGSSAQWPQTTESNYITKTKFKPNNSKRKPTKKPTHNIHKITTKYGAKPTKITSTTESPCIICNALVTGATLEKVSVKPDFVSTSTFTNLVPNGGTETIGCGIPQMTSLPQTRIVGGKSALFGRWPWQVSVRRTSFFGFSSTHRCGGAVLNENWIATAGHCVDDLLTSQIRIRVGEYDFSNAEEELPYVERAITKKVVHPKYNFFTYEYDLALVQLDKPLEYLPHIGPICLPASDDLLIGENATVTGWGRLNEGGTLPSILQEVQVPIVSNDRCKSMFLRAGRHEFIPDIFLCAGHETGGQDSCQGDSGGPLQVKGKDGRYFLAGIISWGIGCAEANLPGVCTRISKFVPWILKNVT